MGTFLRRHLKNLTISFVALYCVVAALFFNQVDLETELDRSYAIEVTRFQICDGQTLTSNPTQQIPQAQFRANQVYLCGYLVNLRAPKATRPRFLIMPEVGAANSWHKYEIFDFAEGFFLIPVEEVTPEVGTYTINIDFGKPFLYSAPFEVVP